MQCQYPFQRKLPKITTFDAIVTVKRHHPDRDALVESAVERLYQVLCKMSAYIYVTPQAIVACDLGTEEFFAKARKVQSEWCQRASSTFARRNRRSAKQWAPPEGRLSRDNRYWQRAACWLGLLFIDGRYVPPSKWPDKSPKQKRQRNANQPSIQQVLEKLLLLSQPGYWDR